jgi:hypothetical protein
MGWLGSSAKWIDPEDYELQESELEWGKWVVSNIGELLSFSAHSAQFVSPKRERVAETLTAFAKKSPEGNFNGFGHWLRMDAGQFFSWCKGKRLPTLLSVLHICYRLNISLKDFYTGDDIVRSIDESPNLPDVLYEIKRIEKALDREETKRTLEMILAREECPPPSMRAVATRLKIEYRRLYRYFPGLCREIASRHMEYRRNLKLQNIQLVCEEVERIVLMLHAEGIEPTEGRVAYQMSKGGYLREKRVIDLLLSLRRSLGYQS